MANRCYGDMVSQVSPQAIDHVGPFPRTLFFDPAQLLATKEQLMPDSPRWELLPADPLGFFGLKANFERKELKRAYGRLIKQFKPETHPQEFQQIRQAYETLESQNRYGMQQSIVTQMSEAWELQVTQAGGQTSEPSRPRGPSIEVEVVNDIDAAIDSPKEAYRRLSKKENRSPQDYFILATLCDLVDRKENMYLKWLLTGANAHPRDPGLQRLLTEYLSAFADTKIASSTLLTLSKFIPGSDFYRISERLWDRLVEEADFQIVAKTLKACEANLKHRSLQPKLAFLLHFLRRSMWKAPSSWIAEQLKFIDQHGTELPSELDSELELLQLVFEYFSQDREGFLNRPLGKDIDSMIEAYCQGSENSMQQVTLICDAIARNGNGVMETFPYDDDEAGSRVLLLCHLIGSEIAFETGADYGRLDMQRLQMQCDATVSDIRKTVEDVGSRIGWMRIRQFAPPCLVLLIGPLILTSGYGFFGWFALFWIPFSILFHFAILKPFWLEKRVESKTMKLIVREYRSSWRPRLFRFVQACAAPPSTSIEQLQQSSCELGEARVMNVVLSYAADDSAMQLFSRMQTFVK